MKFLIHKVISGAQTGVDRAALDAAIKMGINHGGWCPKGRLSESGEIPPKYQIKETPLEDYSQRTTWNIRDSHATLIVVPVWPLNVTDGTVLTIHEVEKQKKPHYIVDLSKPINIEKIIQWIKDNNIQTLNIAGPRESQNPGIYEKSFKLLESLFVKLPLEKRMSSKL